MRLLLCGQALHHNEGPSGRRSKTARVMRNGVRRDLKGKGAGGLRGFRELLNARVANVADQRLQQGDALIEPRQFLRGGRGRLNRDRH